MPKPCAFCAVASGEASAQLVYEDAATVAFLDRAPLAIGHVLLIPRAHVATLFEADAATVTALARATQRIAIGVKAAMASDGVFVAQNNVVSQSVPHLHVHVVPRRFKDGLFARGMVWRRVKYDSPAQMAEVAAAIRSASA